MATGRTSQFQAQAQGTHWGANSDGIMSGPSSLYMSAVSNRKSQTKPLSIAERAERYKARQAAAAADVGGASMYPSSLGTTRKSAPSVRSLRSKSSGTLHSASTSNLSSKSGPRSAPLSLTSSRTTASSASTAATMSISLSNSNSEAGPSRTRSNTAPVPSPVRPIPPPPSTGSLRTPSSTTSAKMPTSPEPDRADLQEMEMMQMARLKLSNRDQEAMRRMRAQMEGSPDWNGAGPSHTSLIKADGSRLIDQPIPEIPEAGPSRVPMSKPYDHTVVILGAHGVGKTTFIERAIKSWECSPPETVMLSGGVEVSSSICFVPPSSRVEQARTIRFVELDSSHISIDKPQTFWPDGLGELSGVVLCYDGTRATTLSCFDIYLARIAKQGLPMVMIACKNDPGASLEVEAAYGNSLGEPHGTGLIEVTSETGEGRSKMRNGLRWLLYKIEQRARRQLRHLGRLQIPSVPRSPTSAAGPARTSPPKSKASSPPSLPSSTYTRMLHNNGALNGLGPGSAGNHSPTKTHHRSTRTLASSVGEGEATDHRSSGSSFNWMMNGPFSPTDVSTVEGDDTSVGPSKRSSLRAIRSEDGHGQSGIALAMEADKPPDPPVRASGIGNNGISSLPQPVHPPGGAGGEGSIPPKPDGSQAPMCLSLDILFTKLFSFVVANEDERFITTFFLTYRRFCSPLTLMNEFRTRFKEVEDAPIVADAKNWALMKITGQLIDWVAEYPGDIADPATRDVYQDFQNSALQYTFMAHLTAELVRLGTELHAAKDIDYSWCISNPANTPAPKQQAKGSSGDASQSFDARGGDTATGVAASIASTPAETPTDDVAPTPQRQVSSDTSIVTSTRSLDTGSTMVNSTNGMANGSGSVPSASGPGPGAYLGAKMRPSVEGHRSVSSSSISIGSQHVLHRHPSGGGSASEEGAQAQWTNAFGIVADGDVRTFAVELTKMQWKVFVAIRPRDVLRHDLGKEEDDPVALAIAFFNRLSRWVSTVILFNPKPKHRARVYERFILIAHQLRRLNNYDSLYAVISGMKETSIHRLSQTHALISPLAPGQKEFQSHSKLMDPRGGYTLYRRALDADIDNENTAIPLLTSIISMINRLQSVRRDDVNEDGDVQWDKFAKFGQILSVITDFQSRGPMVSGDVSPAFQAMINEMPVIMSEDGLFERSRMLEPSNGQPMPPRDGRIMGLLQGKQKWADAGRYEW